MSANAHQSHMFFTIAIYCLVRTVAISYKHSLPQDLLSRHEHENHVEPARRSAQLRHHLDLHKRPLIHLQTGGMSIGNDNRQHPGPPQHQETPGSRMSRLIPDEWKPAVSWFLTVVLFAFFYKRLVFYVPDVDASKMGDPNPNFKEWRYDLFDCCSEPLFCLVSCVFPSLTLADNLTKTRIGAFFATVIVSAFLIAMNFMVLILPWCAFAVYCTFHRQQLRNAFEMNAEDNSIYTDCLLYLFCNPCTLTQDARHIEEAAQVGHPAVERERVRLRMFF